MLARWLTWSPVWIASALAGCSIHAGSRLLNVNEREDFQTTADLEGISAVVIETKNGAVEVQCASDVRKADISGTKSANGRTREEARERVETIAIVVQRDTARADLLRIVADFHELDNCWAGVSFKIALPTDKAVQVRSSNGGVIVRGARRPVDLATSNGSIHVASISGDVHASTSNGGVTLEDIMGTVEANTSNGNCRLLRVDGERVRMATSNGGIQADQVRGQTELATRCGSIRGSGFGGDLVASTSNAGISLTDVAGSLAATSSNSNIDVRRVAGPLTARTSNASILVEDAAADVSAQSSCGKIQLTRVGQTQVTARTSNASIVAVETRGKLQLDTTCGSIEVRNPRLDRADARLSTSNASVSLELPADIAARLKLRTSNAPINTRFGSAQVSGMQTSRDTLECTLNGGGGSIEVNTSSGRIDVRTSPVGTTQP